MRYRQYLRERYRLLLGYSGLLISIIGALNLVPVTLIPFFPEVAAEAPGYLLAGAPLIVIGLLLNRRFAPRDDTNVTVQEGSVVVVIAWLVATFSGAIPLMINADLDFTQAVFESTSGWTTTGLTVVDVTQVSNLTLFYRSLLQLAGGAGFAIIALSAVAGSFSAGMVSAEGRTDQLAPHVRRSAFIVLSLYAGYNIAGIVLLRLAGMSWFDAINHAWTAVAGGGFSTRPESIAYWDSAAIEAVLMVLMILGAVNFFIAYTFIKGKFRAVLLSGEIRLMVVLLALGAVLILGLVTSSMFAAADKALRVALFEVTSALTTTGFQTVDYRSWPDFGMMVLLALFLVGGGTGSTAGGIKLLRIYVLYKAVRWEIQRAFLPRHAINEPAIWHGEKRDLMTDKQVRQAALFIGLYVTVFLIGSGLMMAYGYSMRESLFEFGSALGTTGLTSGVTRPDMPPLLLWAKSLAMLLGRLEFFALIIGVIKLTMDSWDMLRPMRANGIKNRG
jgi:trk system potassium uptake protein TrkH